ncbi:MAG: M14 family zinc carboxypeptidase [Gaiellaceae bacterium]
MSLVHTGGALAQAPNQVTGLAAVQEDGFATLSWNPVEGATDYQVERTPVDAADQPTGPATIVGLWQPTRTVTPDAPTFAESGFVLGERFCWRVRARFGAEEQPFSEPVCGTTSPQWGTGPGASLRTQFEQTNGESFTSDVNEYLYTAALDAASERVRVVEIGRTLLGRPINMFVFGHPEPLASAKQISESPTTLIQCNVHGNEPSMRESCLILARELAFTDDRTLLRIMERSTVLIIPTLNGDGRAANTRGSSTGQDLNRDHSLLREPETKAFSAMLRDYTPDVAVDGHNGDSEDLPVLGPRHLNVYEGLHLEAKTGLIESWIYDNAALAGWYAGPYSNGGASQETILRNTFGLKNIVGLLSENRASAGSTRPGATPAGNQNRRTYGQLWLAKQVLEYYYENHATVRRVVTDSLKFQRRNIGRVVFRGSYPWPLFPPLPSAPDVDAPEPDAILEDPPCGYFLTEEQYTGEQPEGTVELRLGLHGMFVQPAPGYLVRELGPGYFVRMAQPLRGLVPTLLDQQAAEPMVGGTRLQDGSKGRCDQVVPIPFQAAIWSAGSDDYVSD